MRPKYLSAHPSHPAVSERVADGCGTALLSVGRRRLWAATHRAGHRAGSREHLPEEREVNRHLRQGLLLALGGGAGVVGNLRAQAQVVDSSALGLDDEPEPEPRETRR